MSRSTRFCPSHEDFSMHLYELFTTSLHAFYDSYRIVTDYTDNILLSCFGPQNFFLLPIISVPSMHVGLVIPNTPLPHIYLFTLPLKAPYFTTAMPRPVSVPF